MPDIKSALQAALLRAPSHVQTVVQKTINEWDDEGEKHFPINISSVSVQTKPTQTNPMPTTKPTPEKVDGRTKNYMQRETFYCIKNHPGRTARQIGEIMAQRGYKAHSVTATCSHMVQAGMVRRDDDKLLYTLVNEYSTLPVAPATKINRMKKKIEELRQVAKSKGIKDLPHTPAKNPKEGIAALTPMPAPAPIPMPMNIPAPAPRPILNAFDPKAILDPLTVYQARTLYNELKAMFGA